MSDTRGYEMQLRERDDRISQLRARVEEFKWRKEPPDSEGWWNMMLKDDDEPEVVLVNEWSLKHLGEFLSLSPGILWLKLPKPGGEDAERA